MPEEETQTAAAIRELAKQVDALGNALKYVGDTIAKAIKEGQPQP